MEKDTWSTSGAIFSCVFVNEYICVICCGAAIGFWDVEKRCGKVGIGWEFAVGGGCGEVDMEHLMHHRHDFVDNIPE